MSANDELREFASIEGGAFGECNPDDESWAWTEGRFDVDLVVGRPMVGRSMDRVAWVAWLQEEIDMGAGAGMDESAEASAAYMDRLAQVLRESPDSLPPVVVAVHPDGRVEIGDGWHRFALAIRDGIASLPAVIGRMMRAVGPTWTTRETGDG